ncbi:MAG: hypothetical protein K2X63_10885 [Burkholderiaceae bacterium]|jgi:hypothetical protein|nr:hypothetical protein [Burkholderiaceae bacterium]
MTIWNLIGTLGAIAIIAAYALLQAGRWNAMQIRYSLVNASGASCILISLIAEPNLPSIIIESFWLLISIMGIARSYRKQKPSNRP